MARDRIPFPARARRTGQLLDAVAVTYQGKIWCRRDSDRTRRGQDRLWWQGIQTGRLLDAVVVTHSAKDLVSTGIRIGPAVERLVAMVRSYI